MSLSQGIIKKWLLPFILCFSMIFAFFPQSKAEAAGPVYLNGNTTVYKEIIVTSPNQKINFYGTNLTYLDVKMWVKNETTGNYLYRPVTLYSEGSQIGPRSYPYTNLRPGKYRIYLQGYSYFAKARGDIYFVR